MHSKALVTANENLVVTSSLMEDIPCDLLFWARSWCGSIGLRAGRVSPLALGPRTGKEGRNSLTVVDMEEYWAGVDVRS